MKQFMNIAKIEARNKFEEAVKKRDEAVESCTRVRQQIAAQAGENFVTGRSSPTLRNLHTLQHTAAA